jgi:hypothetical protein
VSAPNVSGPHRVAPTFSLGRLRSLEGVLQLRDVLANVTPVTLPVTVGQRGSCEALGHSRFKKIEELVNRLAGLGRLDLPIDRFLTTGHG